MATKTRTNTKTERKDLENWIRTNPEEARMAESASLQERFAPSMSISKINELRRKVLGDNGKSLLQECNEKLLAQQEQLAGYIRDNQCDALTLDELIVAAGVEGLDHDIARMIREQTEEENTKQACLNYNENGVYPQSDAAYRAEWLDSKNTSDYARIFAIETPEGWLFGHDVLVGCSGISVPMKSDGPHFASFEDGLTVEITTISDFAQREINNSSVPEAHRKQAKRLLQWAQSLRPAAQKEQADQVDQVEPVPPNRPAINIPAADGTIAVPLHLAKATRDRQRRYLAAIQADISDKTAKRDKLHDQIHDLKEQEKALGLEIDALERLIPSPQQLNLLDQAPVPKVQEQELPLDGEDGPTDEDMDGMAQAEEHIYPPNEPRDSEDEMETCESNGCEEPGVRRFDDEIVLCDEHYQDALDEQDAMGVLEAEEAA